MDFKNKRIKIFSATAIAVLVILAITAFYAISFMKESITSTLDSNLKKQAPVIRFDFEKLKNIGIITNQ
mgnify:FL=1